MTDANQTGTQPAVATADFTVNDGQPRPEFRTSKVEFDLNGQVLLGTLDADRLWQVTYDMSAVLRAGDNTLRITAYDHRASAKTVVTLARFTPVALADSAIVAHNTPMVVDALGNDSDKDGEPLVVTAFTQGQHGTVTTNGSRLIYTPQPGYAGSDSFDYTVSDEKEGTADATITVQVQPAPPTLSINDVSVNEAAGEAFIFAFSKINQNAQPND